MSLGCTKHLIHSVIIIVHSTYMFVDFFALDGGTKPHTYGFTKQEECIQYHITVHMRSTQLK